MVVSAELQRGTHPRGSRDPRRQGWSDPREADEVGTHPLLGPRRSTKYSTINATIEKLTEAASWKSPWNRGQRCIVPAMGFYEWQVQADGKTKQPFFITCGDQEIFGFAGLWDSSTTAEDVKVNSCTIVTMPANKIMSEIHNAKQRMPAILRKEDRETWLKGDLESALKVLQQYPDELLIQRPVSPGGRPNSPIRGRGKLLHLT